MDDDIEEDVLPLYFTKRKTLKITWFRTYKNINSEKDLYCCTGCKESCQETFFINNVPCCCLKKTVKN